jgi:uncharacterized protein (DUF736 family)
MENIMIIGTFVYDKETDSFSGDIATLHFQYFQVHIKPAGKNAEKGPDYRLIAGTPHGHIELGAGWKRTSDQGRDFISVSLDSPLLDAPLNVALFNAEKGTGAIMVWNRPRAEPKTAKSPAKKAA